jgi:hypothetical protein
MRTLCLTAALALSACAAFDEPIPQPPYTPAPGAMTFVLPAGSRACVGPGVTSGKCEALDRITEELHTPAMVAAICAAGADAPECRK